MGKALPWDPKPGGIRITPRGFGPIGALFGWGVRGIDGCSEAIRGVKLACWGIFFSEQMATQDRSHRAQSGLKGRYLQPEINLGHCVGRLGRILGNEAGMTRMRLKQ